MKPLLMLFPILVVFLIGGGCGRDQAVDPEDGAANAPSATLATEQLAAQVVYLSGWLADAPEGSTVEPTVANDNVTLVLREPVVGDVVHYKYLVRVGAGPHDFIGLHRVVRERAPNEPIRTKKNVFMEHGDIVGFEGVFLLGSNSPSSPDDFSIAAFLAADDVDVWGIDQNWVLVPEGTADLSFMADWGLQNQIENMGMGLAVAREVRKLTGNGFGKMHLLGYSAGVWAGYAYLNEESQVPPGLRHVRGFIQVDSEYKTNDPATRAGYCETAAFYQDLYDSGVYADDFGTIFVLMVELARTDPDGPSPVFEGFTNMQAVIGLGTYPVPPPEWFHYFAGEFDEDEMPVGLVATRLDAWLDFMATASPYESVRFLAEFYSVTCEQVDVPWDDHLSDITVPILVVSAIGGDYTGDFYTTTLLGSTDITTVVAGLTPPADDVLLEFGHLDLFLADVDPNRAELLAWEPMRIWIEDHMRKGKGRGDDRRN